MALTAAWIIANREDLEGEAVRRAASSQSLHQEQSRWGRKWYPKGNREVLNLSKTKDVPWLWHWKLAEKSCRGDVPQHGRADTRRSPASVSAGLWDRDFPLVGQDSCCSAESYSGLPSTASLVDPPPSKSHTADCTPGKSRKHNFHRTLKQRKWSRPFLWKCCIPPRALCDQSCLESKWSEPERQ